jgi:hypothetical protein
LPKSGQTADILGGTMLLMRWYISQEGQFRGEETF